MAWPSSVTGTEKHLKHAFWDKKMKWLAENRNEIWWWEKERKNTWEYVHFPMMTISYLIFFFQSSKTIPMPAYPWCNFSIFLPSNINLLAFELILYFCYNWYIFFSPIKSHFPYLWFKFLPLLPSQGLHFFSYSLPPFIIKFLSILNIYEHIPS